jgi:hypothetical protein
VKSTWIKLAMTGVGILLVFFGPEDFGLSIPAGIGLIAAAWLEEW